MYTVVKEVVPKTDFTIMSSLDNKLKSLKGKLTLQKKNKKPTTDLVNIINNPALNETCEFRSVEKMNKFFSATDRTGVPKKGRLVKKNLQTDGESDAKAKSKIVVENLSSIAETDTQSDIKDNKNNDKPQSENESKIEADVLIIEDEKEQNKGYSKVNESEGSDSQGKCTACGKSFSSKDMAAHLQSCLKARFQRGSRSVVSTVIDQEVKLGELENFFCQICQKDLTKMNSQRRSQHLNKCIDKDEEEQRLKDLEKKAFEDAKSMVLDCPMCGKVCKTENARKVHVKKCCQNLKIPTEQMLKLVKQQEEDHQIMLAAGILPKSILSKLKTKGKSTGALMKTKKKAKEPKSQYDADLQMAMAMSMSETKPTVKAETKRGKKKGGSEPAMLVALTKEEKKRRLSQRITTVLIPEEEDSDVELTPEFISSTLPNKYTDEITQIPLLWRKCSLQEDSSNKENWNKDLFYVKCLVPPIEVNRVKPGSKVRRMSEIPGRDSSFMKPKTPVKAPLPQTEVTRNEIGSQSLPDDSMVASTQTAMVLAELAADASQMTPDTLLSQTELNCSGFCPEVPIVVQSKQTSSLLQQLQRSMLLMVNNPTHSDVEIYTAGNDIVYCHRAILTCRCPEILKLEESGKIYLQSFSLDAINSLMKYIYGGLVSVTESCLTDILILTERFKLTELHNILQELQAKSESVQDFNSLDLHSKDKTSVECLLKQLWSDSDDESESQGLNEEDDGIGSDRVDVDDEGQVQGQSPEKNFSEVDVQSSRFSEESDLKSISETETKSIRRKIFKNSPLKVMQIDQVKEDLFETFSDKINQQCAKKMILSNKSTKHESPDKKLKNSSIIYENEDLEVYSNVSSSEKSSISDMNLSQNLETDQPSFCPSVKDDNEVLTENLRISNKLEVRPEPINPEKNNKYANFHHSLSPGSDIKILDREYSPEIPLLPASQSMKVFDQPPIDTEDVVHTKLMTSFSHDDLPTINSPQKFKQLRGSSNKKDKSMDVDKKLDFNNCSRRQNDKSNETKDKGEEFCNSSTKMNQKKKDFNITSQNNMMLHESFDDSNDSLIILDDNSNHGNTEVAESYNKVDNHISNLCDNSNEYSGALNASLNTSGGDLFASPSPVIQRSRSQGYTSSHEISCSQTGAKTENLNLSHSGVTISRKAKRKTFELESPTDVPETSKRFKTKDSNDCDVSFVSDNFFELTSKQSPKFKTKERKWKFSSKSDFVKSSDITFSGTISAGTNLGHSADTINIKKSLLGGEISSEENHDKLTKSLSLDHSTSNEVFATTNNGDKCFEEEDQPGVSITESESDEGINLIDPEECVTGGDSTMECVMDVSTVTGGVSLDDVWEGFDDIGAGEFGGIVNCDSPGINRTRITSEIDLDSPKATEKRVKETSTETECLEDQENVEFENLTFCDESLMQQEHGSNSIKNIHDFKTPVMPKKQKKTKEWKEPSPFTPMPKYDDMATPVIKKHVQNYGVKPVGKKRMIKLLKDIYHKTHQYETDSEFEDDGATETDVKTSDMGETENQSDSDEDDKSFNDSQESIKSDMMEETYLEEEDTQPLKPGEKSLSDRLMDFINQQSEIQIKVLMYEPLELDVLKQKITDAGIKCGMEKLKEFLDDKCITFTMKNMRRSPKKKRRSPKKAKSKDSSPKKIKSKDSSPKKTRSKDSSPKKAKSKVNSPVKDSQKSPSRGRGRGKKKINP